MYCISSPNINQNPDNEWNEFKEIHHTNSPINTTNLSDLNSNLGKDGTLALMVPQQKTFVI